MIKMSGESGGKSSTSMKSYKDQFDSQEPQRLHHLPLLLRLYIYSLHGYFIEVTFTAVWDFVLVRDWKLAGCSSIWSLAIYGTCGLAIEELSIHLRRNKIPFLLRGALYLILVYFWEFTSGYILTYFNACPWDYSEFSYNIGGLITLEYAPFWLLSGLVMERALIRRLEQFRWSEFESVQKASIEANGLNPTQSKILRKSE